MGRPRRYKPKLALSICERLVEGESLRAICRTPGMPAKSIIFRWLESYPEFRDQYARAREMQAETLADEMTEIADDGTNDWVLRYGRSKVDENGEVEKVELGWEVNHEYIQRSRLRVDTRKWIASKLLPKKYGDRIDHTLGDGQGGPAKLVLEFVSASPVPEEA